METERPSKEFVDKLTKEIADKGLLIEAGWVGYKLAVVPTGAGDIQIRETRMAFFAGAQHLFTSMLNALDDDREPTAADLKRMDLIHDELDRFLVELKKSLQ